MTTVITEAQFKDWLSEATAGDKCVYAVMTSSFHPSVRATDNIMRTARAASEAGEVMLFQKRIKRSGDLHYTAVRVSPETVKALDFHRLDKNRKLRR